MLKTSGWWITGLADGEGCFFTSLSFRSRSTKSGGSTVCVDFEIKFEMSLRADDLPTLEKFQQYFGCGEIKDRDSKNCPSVKKRVDLLGGAEGRPQKVFIIRNADVLLESIVPHFDLFPLQSKKARDYDIWKKILMFYVMELRGKKKWVKRFPDQIDHLASLCSELRGVREFAPLEGEN